MRVLLRQVIRKSKTGSATSTDVSLNRSSIRIGRGTDQDVCLSNIRVSLAHAEIVQSNDRRIRINAVGGAGLRHNGSLVQSALLGIGDVIEIGGFKLEVTKAEGVDFMLTVEELPATRGKEMLEAMLARSRMSLAEAGLSKRRWSWILLSTIVVIFLLIPVVGVFVPALQPILRGVPALPSDQSWTSGPISHSHAGFESKCEACHVTPFIPTPNSACAGCHQGTPHHVEPKVLEAGGMAGDGSRCGACHHEHNGTLSVVTSDERLCSNCHSDLKSTYAETDLGNVDAFADAHPQFRPSFTRFDKGEPRVVRVSMDDTANLKETSNLRFPHKVHLEKIAARDESGKAIKGGIRSPERGVVELECASCHVTQTGGGLMQPVEFEAHCEECHKLTIPGDEFRVVPHGDIAKALATIKDYFSGWALRGGYPNLLAPDVVLERRRPGHDLDEGQRKQALAWAEQQAAYAAGEMLEYTTCGVCHEAERSTAADAIGGWKMQKPAVNTVWLPKHEFSHVKHDTMECKACHLAEKSEDSSDVLLVGENGKVGIESCRECHASQHAPKDMVASTCIACHGFHTAKHAEIHPAPSAATATPAAAPAPAEPAAPAPETAPSDQKQARLDP